jgi:hypothetical protein
MQLTFLEQLERCRAVSKLNHPLGLRWIHVYECVGEAVLYYMEGLNVDILIHTECTSSPTCQGYRFLGSELSVISGEWYRR